MPSPTPCRHCERAPRAFFSVLGLCERCQRSRQIRALYRTRWPGRPANWNAHLDRLSALASHLLPLFPASNPDRPREECQP